MLSAVSQHVNGWQWQCCKNETQICVGLVLQEHRPKCLSDINLARERWSHAWRKYSTSAWLSVIMCLRLHLQPVSTCRNWKGKCYWHHCHHGSTLHLSIEAERHRKSNCDAVLMQVQQQSWQIQIGKRLNPNCDCALHRCGFFKLEVKVSIPVTNRSSVIQYSCNCCLGPLVYNNIMCRYIKHKLRRLIHIYWHYAAYSWSGNDVTSWETGILKECSQHEGLHCAFKSSPSS